MKDNFFYQRSIMYGKFIIEWTTDDKGDINNFNTISISYSYDKDIYLDWDNFIYFINLDKNKKQILKEDLLDKGIWYKGWYKELKKLIKEFQRVTNYGKSTTEIFG